MAATQPARETACTARRQAARRFSRGWVIWPLACRVRPTSEADEYARHIRSSSGIAIFAGQAADKAHWVDVGRCDERFALQTTALGLRNAHLNQPVEVTLLRPHAKQGYCNDLVAVVGWVGCLQRWSSSRSD